jgi:hypothetical protein
VNDLHAVQKKRAPAWGLCVLAVSLIAACKTPEPDSGKQAAPANVVQQHSPPPASVPNVPLPQASSNPQAAQAGAPAGPQARAQPAVPGSASPQAGTPSAANPLISPVAMSALQRMGNYLRSLKAFEIQAITNTDEVVEPGLKVQLDGTVKMQVRRPDGLHMTIDSDRKQRELFFDGKNFTLYSPRLNFYAVTPAPGTLGELFESLAAYDIEMPLADLFLWGTDRSPEEDVKLALPVGPATIDGKKADHYLIGREDVSWQVWIQQGNQPLPIKMVITNLAVPQQPQHVTVMRWNLAPTLDDKRFVYTPGKDAVRIPLRAPAAAR